VTYHTVRFVYPMAIDGGAERREVDGSTDEFGWFTTHELRAMRLGDLVERVVQAEGGLAADEAAGGGAS
jgi:hypothetical protein